MEVSVFISYCHLDGDLVFGEIRPLLQTAAVRTIVDAHDFRLGLEPKEQMTTAVHTNDFTIAVVTQNYVDSEWATMEAAFASELRRLVPIVMQMPTKIPKTIQSGHCYGEALDPREWDGNFKRLLTAIGLSPEQADQALLQRPPRSIRSLHCRIRHPIAQGQIRKFWEVYQRAEPSYELLKACKTLHDAFHRAQLSFRSLTDVKLAIENALGTTAEQADMDRLWKSLEIRAKDLRSELIEVLNDAEPIQLTSDRWKLIIDRCANDLMKAVDNLKRDFDSVKRVLERIQTPLWTEPTYLNGIIRGEKDRLEIPQLCEPLNIVASFLREIEFARDAATLVKAFFEATRSFEATGRELVQLIDNHNILQALDDEFAVLDEIVQPSMKDIQGLLNRATTRVGNLESQHLPQNLKHEVENLKVTLAVLRKVIEHQATIAPVKESFADFRAAVSRTFHATDIQLKRASDLLVRRLRQVQDTLWALDQ